MLEAIKISNISFGQVHQEWEHSASGQLWPDWLRDCYGVAYNGVDYNGELGRGGLDRVFVVVDPVKALVFALKYT